MAIATSLNLVVLSHSMPGTRIGALVRLAFSHVALFEYYPHQHTHVSFSSHLDYHPGVLAAVTHALTTRICKMQVSLQAFSNAGAEKNSLALRVHQGLIVSG